MLLYVQRTIRTIRGGEPRTATSTLDTAPEGVPLLMLLYVQRTIRTIRGGEPRTATSTFSQLLNSEDSV